METVKKSMPSQPASMMIGVTQRSHVYKSACMHGCLHMSYIYFIMHTRAESFFMHMRMHTQMYLYMYMLIHLFVSTPPPALREQQ